MKVKLTLGCELRSRWNCGRRSPDQICLSRRLYFFITGGRRSWKLQSYENNCFFPRVKLLVISFPKAAGVARCNSKEQFKGLITCNVLWTKETILLISFVIKGVKALVVGFLYRNRDRDKSGSRSCRWWYR
ncbi:hypothetical protein O6P43_006425 [Quillaja saponaria]|uniref:Uncharacterized protein n=1 Tax=Quillaja saponaria TaxID=32244 RepID=A0AAD7VIE8_QUISA|nr:hypothetical protein O6P43_006425 [Quillaja saponaria]